MNCLLCQSSFREKMTFHDLWLLKIIEKPICPSCQAQFSKISEQHCPRCFKSGAPQICKDCKLWEEKGFVVNHQAIFHYNKAMQDYFAQYKFLGDYRLHKVFQSYFSQLDKNFTLVPIPLSEERYQQQGFNQVAAFLPEHRTQDILEKIDTAPQSSLSRKERLATLNPFVIKSGAILPQKVILIDDIYTTGTTLYHAASLLKKHGVSEVKSYSLCR